MSNAPQSDQQCGHEYEYEHESEYESVSEYVCVGIWRQQWIFRQVWAKNYLFIYTQRPVHWANMAK